MLILWKARQKDPSLGYAPTFLGQLEEVLGTCLDRGIKIVTNAGGLNPSGLADRVRRLSERLGLQTRVAHVEGDDLVERVPDLRVETPGVLVPSPERQWGHHRGRGWVTWTQEVPRFG